VNLNRSNKPRPVSALPEQLTKDGIPYAALDAVAAILRVLAQVTPPDSEAASELEAWARHVLVLAEAPGARGADPSERDWPRLSRRVVALVRDDSAAVARSMGELRGAVWSVVEHLSQVVVSDAACDSDARNQLDQLRVAIDGPPAELKETALATVRRLSEIIEEKHARQLQLASELGRRVDVLKVELEDTRREADIDPLTQVWNRGVFQRELPRTLQLRALLDEPACLAMVDIDRFKQINDAHGHTTGDAALELIAGALVRSFPRRSDVVTRLGGDEFAVILPSTTTAVGRRLAERFLEVVRELEMPGTHESVSVTVSVGVAEALPSEQAESWLARADVALYQAKAQGRNCVVIAADESQTSQ
jgi:diguanylate cyclase (GGDEF)-like protein